MSVERTPQGNRTDGAGAAGVFTAPPPQLGQAPMVLTPDQFQAFLETCKASPGPPVAAIARDDGGEDFPNVSSVAVKLPTFWTHDPELWFLQTESVFSTRTPKVTRDQTKFDHVVTALPADALNLSLIHI